MPIVGRHHCWCLSVSLGRVYQANKLTTVKKCLNEVLKYGGAFSPRDLYPVRPTSVYSQANAGHEKPRGRGLLRSDII